MSNSVRRRSRSRNRSCLARKDSTATANSLATRLRNASSSSLGVNGARQPKPNAPKRFSPAVKGTKVSERRPAVVTHSVNSGQRDSASNCGMTNRLLMDPDPACRVLFYGQASGRAHFRRRCGIEHIGTHALRLAIMQDQRREIERDDPLKRFGHPGQEAAKIVAAGNRPGQRQDRLINVLR